MLITSISICLDCCMRSCSRPPNMLRPIGRRRFKQATLRLAVISIFFGDRFLPLPLVSVLPWSGAATAACLSWLGIISAMLSISFANTKFCSSFLNSCKKHVTRHLNTSGVKWVQQISRKLQSVAKCWLKFNRTQRNAVPQLCILEAFWCK